MLFRVLGDLAVENADGQPVLVSARKRRLLLGMLLASPNRVVSSDRLADGLWGDDLPQAPDAAVRVHVSRLRNDLGGGEEIIVTRPHGYLVRVGPDELDVQVFERLVDEGDRASSDAAFGVAADKYRTGLNLWQGDAFQPFVYETWAQAEIRRLAELHWYAIEQVAEADLQLGRHAQLIPELESSVAAEPLREGLWGKLMVALYRSGRQSDALRAFTRARETLVEQLGVDPSDELRRLEQRILEQDPVLAVPQAPQEDTTTLDMVLLAVQWPASDPNLDELRLRTTNTMDRARGEVFELRRGLLIAAFDDVANALQAARVLLETVGVDGASQPRLAIDQAAVQRTDGGFRGLAIHRAARIAGIANPGQVLVSEAVADLTGGRESLDLPPLTDTGEHELPGVTDPLRLFELVGTEGKGDRAGVGQGRLTNLPAQLTTFVGRAAEIETLTALLADQRLVTITGPGGVGKTRLALQAASDLVGEYRDGVWLAELASIADPEGLSVTIGQAIGLSPQAPDPRQDLLDSVTDLHALIVVDNCEHLIEDVADLVHAILTTGSEVKVLATSREPLGVPGEVPWSTPVLSVPDPDRMPALNDLDRNDAVGLFLARAKTALPGFELGIDNADTIVRICRDVDGLPLAIELLAAQLRHRGVDELESGLRSILETRSSYRTVPARHKTLEAAAAWSYRTLDSEEQALFRHLSVFPDTLDLPAVIAVGVTDATTESDLPALMEALVDKSLVTVVRKGDDRRYRLLATLRSYAQARIAEAGAEGKKEQERLEALHADYYADWASAAYEHTHASEQAIWLDRMAIEQSNIITALHWALDQGVPELAARLASSYAWFWLLRGPLTLGRRLVEEAIAAGGDRTSTGRQLLMGAGYLCGELGDVQAARRYLEAKLEGDDAAGDAGAAAGTLSNLGVVAERAFDHRVARDYFQRSIEVLSAEPPTEITWERLSASYQNIAATLREMGSLDEARSSAEQAVELARKCGHRYVECHAVLALVQLDIDSSDLDAAVDRLEDAELITTELRDDTAAYQSAIQRSRLESAQGRLVEAHNYANEAWRVVIESGDRSRLPEVADQAALVALAMGDIESVGSYAEVALGKEQGVTRVPGLQLLAAVAVATGRVEEAAELLTEAERLQQRRGCVTWADLRPIVAEIEATLSPALDSRQESIERGESA